MERPRTEDEVLLSWLGSEGDGVAEEEVARLQGINRQMLSAFSVMDEVGPAVSVFGSARTPAGDPVYEKAVAVAAALGHAGYAIITGAGPGLMEAANRGAVEAGTRSVGLDIELPLEQGVNPWVRTELRFHHFFARKVVFVRYACAFVIHPGGFGTMDELFEALNLISTATIRDFPVILVGSDHWRGLLAWMDEHMVGSGELEPAEAGLLRVTDDPAEVVAIVAEANERQRG